MKLEGKTPVGLEAGLGSKAAEGDIRRPRILVVEDETLIALDVAHELEARGYRVVGRASSIGAALELCDTVEFEAAILDVKLGTDDSTLVARRLVERGTPVLVVSGYTNYEGIFQTLPKLQKPFNYDELVSSLQQLLHEA